MPVCTDCVGSPTYTEDLAGAYEYCINNLLDHNFGTYNCINKSERGVSRFEFAFELIRILGADVEIVPCKIDELKDEFPAPRTHYEVLAAGIGMRDWADALKEYIDAYH